MNHTMRTHKSATRTQSSTNEMHAPTHPSIFKPAHTRAHTHATLFHLAALAPSEKTLAAYPWLQAALPNAETVTFSNLITVGVGGGAVLIAVVVVVGWYMRGT